MKDISRVAIVMSRMPRLISPDANWLRGLRACLRRTFERSQILLISPGTSGSDFVVRGAERLGVATQPVSVDETDLRDQPLIHHADELLVLGIRRGGNIQRLLIDRLRDGAGRVLLIDLPDLQPPSVRQELLDLGATLWCPAPESLKRLSEIRDECPPLSSPDSILPLAALPRDDMTPYLTHTTRACPGPWPQQSQNDYLDSLLDASGWAAHSALQTLRRIVVERRLIGSSKTIRGSYPVVSFTATSIRDIPNLRCFQTHRSRWDFEPFAISIRRDVLERLGVQAVVYGNEETWEGLEESQRPYFQLSGAPHHDWSSEREWRHPGDLDLSIITGEELVVLVPTVEAARLLQPHCPWPLTLWPGDVGG